MAGKTEEAAKEMERAVATATETVGQTAEDVVATTMGMAAAAVEEPGTAEEMSERVAIKAMETMELAEAMGASVVASVRVPVTIAEENLAEHRPQHQHPQQQIRQAQRGRERRQLFQLQELRRRYRHRSELGEAVSHWLCRLLSCPVLKHQDLHLETSWESSSGEPASQVRLSGSVALPL